LFSLIASRSALKNIFILNLSLKACTLQKWDDHQRMPLSSSSNIIHIAAWNRGSEVVNEEEEKSVKTRFILIVSCPLLITSDIVLPRTLRRAKKFLSAL
jgi:hypothetical protein